MSSATEGPKIRGSPVQPRRCLRTREKSDPPWNVPLTLEPPPDIILETAAERKDPDRAAQFYRKTRLESWL